MPYMPQLPTLAPPGPPTRRPRRQSTGSALPGAPPSLAYAPAQQQVAVAQAYPAYTQAEYDRRVGYPSAYPPANYPVAQYQAAPNPQHPVLYQVNTPWAGPTALPPMDEAPQLHNLLSSNARPSQGYIDWDIRNSPNTARVIWPGNRSGLVTQYGTTSAFTPGVPRIRLVCKDLLPWQITVASPDGGPISITDIFNSIYKELHRPLAESEFWACGEKERAKLTETWNREMKTADGRERANQGVLRVDWAGGKTVFAGLGIDQDFIASRVQDERLHPEVWVLHLRSSPIGESSTSRLLNWLDTNK
ncbi:hypothetical protein FRC06_002333 [Ceratobasidium sp. 370]|nr:hypothetical protein FRC06_002333 [Ceratobasidium sp. 370]